MRALKWFGGLLLGLLLVVLLWGSAVEPRFLLDVQSHDAPVPGLPEAWEGERIVLLADLQVGMWWDNTGMVEKIVEEALASDPAAILIAGDFVYKADSAVVREAVALVAPLADGDVPVLAVLGNHDYSLAKEDDEPSEELAAYLAQELEGVGITVLENEARAVREGDDLWVVGIGSEWAGRSRPEQAMAGVPSGAARVVLMHNPVAFRDMPPHSGGLTLAAHTHGGQVRLPFLPSRSWLDIAREREVVADGWAVDSIGAAGNNLYVNRGVGFSAVPVRIRCQPELTVLTLRAAETMPTEDATEPGEPEQGEGGGSGAPPSEG